MSRLIKGSIDGPVILSRSLGSDDPLFISSTGTINSSGDGIDGAAGTPWIIINQGTISSPFGSGIALAGAGFLYNSGMISGAAAGVAIGGDGFVVNEGSIDGGQGGIEIDGDGVVANQGVIETAGNGGSGIGIYGRGVVANEGLIFGIGCGISLGEGSIKNWGTISGSSGVILTNGGSVTNLGTILGQGDVGVSGGGITSLTNMGVITNLEVPGCAVELETGRVTNFGTILGGALGVRLGGGLVANHGSISGGVEITGGGGTVINQGVISDGGYLNPGVSVLFDPSTANNLLEIKPGAVFHGAAEATSGTNSTIELTRGRGAIKGIGGGQFNGFDKLEADQGARWALRGPNTIGTVLNDGSLGVSGSLDVSTAIDPASAGLFSLTGASTLEIAAALGMNSKMSFAPGSELMVDNFAMFGENVGAANYAGPRLESFSGSTVDLKNFNVEGLDMKFSASTGLLQFTNAESQVATLEFQRSTLGAGTFHFVSDGNSGVLITHS